jgi:nucleoside-diphosphate-sugar epimerase
MREILKSIMKQMDVVIAGCGFTGRRVAARLLAAGARVLITVRDPASAAELERRGAEVIGWNAANPQALKIPDGAFLLHSIPSLVIGNQPVDPTPALLGSLRGTPSRIVYLSTTGVYGAARDVDHRTPVEPRSSREQVRVDAEKAAAEGPWSTLVLRPAAIYGPGRGIHVSMAHGEYSLVGDGQNFVSRIHVDDLAAHAEAGLLSSVAGAYPVADEHPCTAREIAEFCAKLLHVPMPGAVRAEDVHDTRRADRRVDGNEIRGLLGLYLRYPSYHTGIPESLP